MVHILLLILKIIGIIIAAILGILVLLVCIVLFVPLKYSVNASCGGALDSLEADISGSWLLHLISFTASYRRKKFKWKLRILCKRMTGEEQTDTGDINKREKEVAADEEKHEEILEKAEETTDHSYEELPGIQKDDDEEAPESFFEKCRQTFLKIKCTILRFCDKIKSLSEKKKKISEFIMDDIHRAAFWKLKKEVLHLLKCMRPKKMSAKVHFGFEDPYRTGQALAGFSLLYPFIGKQTEIIPDFENRILEGTLGIRGKIRVLHFAALLWKLLLCKEVRTTYKHVRSF